MSVSARRRREAFVSVGGAIRLVHEVQAFCDENGLKSLADDLWMINQELVRVRGSIYSPEYYNRQLRFPRPGETPEQLPDSA